MAQGSHNNDAFMGSAAQFMQAGQNMMQQFMDYLGKAGGSTPAAPLPPADPQALTALQKQFMDQQMSLWQAMLVKQQGQEPAFNVAPEPGDRRFSAPEWKESPIYDYVHQAYLLNTQYLKQMSWWNCFRQKTKRRTTACVSSPVSMAGCHGTVEFRGDQSRVHQAGGRDQGPEHY
jgi:hypothetical protein